MSIKLARLIRFLFFGTLVFPLPLDSQKAISATPLDEYVAAPDSNYSFTHDRTEDTGGLFNQPWFQTHYLDMTSQKWRSEVGSDRAIWTHKLTITRANIRVLTPKTHLIRP